MELLVKRNADLRGILNGIDEDIYNPETSSAFVQNYSTSTLYMIKKINKRAIQKKFGLTSVIYL